LTADETDRRGRLRVWGTLAAKTGLTVVVTAFVIRAVGLGAEDFATLEAGWWRPDWILLIGASGLLTLGYAVSALLWGGMVRDLGGGALHPLTTLRIFLTANLARYVPGKVWQIAGLALLARKQGIPPAVATTAAVLGQAAALAGATLVGAATFLVVEDGTRTWGWIALAAVGIGTSVSLIPGAADRMARWWLRISRAEASAVLTVGRTFGIRWVGLYFINWIIYAAAFVMLARSYSITGGGVQIGTAFAAAYVIGYVAVFAPAGIGVRESFLVVFLSPVAGPAPAGGLAIASRVWTTLVEIVTAAVANAVGPKAGAHREETTP
jgi:hypothetical protein